MAQVYSIHLTPSHWQFRLSLGLYGVVLLSLLLWPPFFVFQWIVEVCIALIIVIFARRDIQRWQLNPMPWPRIELQDNGDVKLLKQHDWLPAKVSYRSVSCDWFCLLVMDSSTLTGQTELIKIWIFRDSVDDKSYRRLCRVIHRMRAAG